MTSHPLDRPVWNALAGGWADRAIRAGDAVRLDPAYGPFAAAPPGPPDPRLVRLARLGTPLWLVETVPADAPPGLRLSKAIDLAQMTMVALTSEHPAGDPIVPLGEADSEEMRALALLTKPGPWHALTHRNGGFAGMRDIAGRLVAMAGTRMRMPGFAEVSGVCTHPADRGRGHAFRLMRAVAATMLSRGETPFLHAYAHNAGAIVLYERLGFRKRRTMVLTEMVLA